MFNQINIRKASIDDAQTIAAVCIAVWIDTYCITGVEPSHANYVLHEYTQEKVQQSIAERDVYVAEIEGKVVGTLIYQASNCEIVTLYVLSGFQRQGIGGALMRTFREQTNVPVFLTCWEGNAAAINFYLQYGFSQAGEDFFCLDGKTHRNIVFTYA